MKVPISLLLRLLGSWYLFLCFTLLQLRDARSLSRPSVTPRSSPLKLLGSCRGIVACVAVIALFFFSDPGI